MSVAWVAVGTAAVGTLAGMSAAADANATNSRAIAAQESTADKQARLAQEQWDYQKTTYLPKAMQQADDQLAMSKQLTDAQVANAGLQQEQSKVSFAQAAKSYKYQDQMMGLADDYTSGKVGDAEAGRASADVQQSFQGATGALTRSATRMGINPGSGAFASGMTDLYTQQALASAGAATNSRLNARNKAESLVATAAGAGTAGFGTGIQAGSLSNGALAGAAQTNASSLGGLNSVNGTFTSGVAGVNSTLSSGANSWNSAAKNAQSNPIADFAGGLASTGLKLAGSGLKTPGSGSATPSSPINWDLGF